MSGAFACEQCSKVFKTLQGLQGHMRFKHPDGSGEIRQQVHQYGARNVLKEHLDNLMMLKMIKELNAPAPPQVNQNQQVIETIKIFKELNPQTTTKDMIQTFREMKEFMGEVEPQESGDDWLSNIIKMATSAVPQMQVNQGQTLPHVERAVSPDAAPTTLQAPQTITIDENLINKLLSEIPKEYKEVFIKLPKIMSRGLLKKEIKKRGIVLADKDLNYWHAYAYQKVKKELTPQK